MKIEYPIEWNERDRAERPAKGWLADVVVELENGKRHRLFFYDPVRLKQDLEEEIKLGKAAIVERGLIVVPEVSRETIEKAIRQAVAEGYFEQDR